MNQHLQSILDLILHSETISASEKNTISNTIKEVDKILSITEFKLERTEEVKRITAILLEETIEELEQKRKAVELQNRELEIETSLEKVRSVAMGMQQPADMLDVCRIISDQLQLLQVADIRNVQTAIIDGGKGTYINYQYFTPYQQTTIEEVEYNKHPKVLELVLQMKESADAFFSETFVGEELEVWRQYRKDDNQFPDPILDEATAVYFYFYSIGHGGLGISTYAPLNEEDITIFKRFRNVFDLAYRRFIDIHKAEAQAREAQIEASLERVRAKAMAMHKSEDLNMAVATIFEDLDKLDLGMARCGISILDKEKRSANVFTTSISDEGKSVNVSGDESIDIHPLLQGAFDAWEKQSDFSYVLEGKDLARYYQAVGETNIRLPDSQILLSHAEVIRQYFYVAPFQAGCLFAFRDDSFSEEAKKVMKRFADVFNLTYTRFLDLQKAEAQAREAQIEVALERVRSKALSMHRSEDLVVAVATMFEELEKLQLGMSRCGLGIMDKEKRSSEVWTTTVADHGTTLHVSGDESMDLHPLLQGDFEAWLDQRDFSYTLKGQDLVDYYTAVGSTNFKLPESQIILSDSEVKEQYYYATPFGSGALFAFRETAFTDEAKTVMKRFADVFNLTYTRYNDLKQAEAQTRKAQIEVAVERVRAKALAMHKSEDLHSVVVTLKKELMELRIPNITAATMYLAQNDGSIRILDLSDSGGEDENKPQLQVDKIFRLEETDPDLWIRRMWDRSENYFVLEADEADFVRVVQWIRTFDPAGAEIAEKIIKEKSIKKAWLPTVKLEKGRLNIDLLQSPTDEIKPILLKMGAAFDLAYRRFLDLQKAEAQAREATIEAALERVRGKAMAMHSSEDLSETVNVFFKELKLLGIVPVRCGVNELDEESRTSTVWVTTAFKQGDSHEVIGKIKLSGHPVLEKIFEGWKMQQEYYPVLSGVDLKEYYNFMKPHLAFSHHPDSTIQYGSYFYFKEGLVFAWTEKELSEEEKQIFRRFTAVISLTYRRYVELQKSEAAAKDAVRQASLDRIRAEIASMRTTKDLDRITPLIWKELTILGIPFIRCGVFIMNDAQQLIHTFLSTPDGKAIAAFHLPYSTPGKISQVLQHWQSKNLYTDHWDEKAFEAFAGFLVEQGALKSSKQYLSTLPEGGFFLYFIPFLQGMLYVGNTRQLGEEETKLVQSVTDAFSTAYARYEDFHKLEAAKLQVDKTLSELEMTQAQLIQSEKMASLGELTAGIAHEIQNPMNFVNNFSEVNKELLAEMAEEIEKGNYDAAKLLAKHVEENQEKINYHGKRADAIVKGMLHHSRSSSGVKEPTDINALADEYLRLAYHGLRAKSKSFNASIKTDFDASIGLINVIPQEIGRVILNLITNAFYAVNERKMQQHADYEPTVGVMTRGLHDKIEIRVSDNGNGIPKNILDKIFQPFFTTKPTGQGTGLGLSLSYDIVKAHGGKLKVETTMGENTEFIIQLPCN